MERKIKKALITGISGSGGSYLADYIVKKHPEVELHGISRWHSTASVRNLDRSAKKLTLHECDLMDFSSILGVLGKAKPDAVFHLASHANVRASFITPLSVMDNNIMGTANLLEAIKSVKIDPVVQICSCYDEKTELLTKRGFVKFNEIRKDDEVVSIDPVTNNVDYKPINKIIVQDYEGAMKQICLLPPTTRLFLAKNRTGN